MSLHTYRARSLVEALRLVREELGPDASVLHTRQVGGRVARWLGNSAIEVTASADVAVPSRLSLAHAADDQHLPAAELHDYRHKIRADLLNGAGQEPSLVEQLAATRCTTAQPSTLDFGSSTATVGQPNIRGPIRLRENQQTIVALVGPTGVGKTTTLAKLAAHFHLHERRRVGLITTDVYRIAAAEQVRTYAQIMHLPMEVVASPGEMRQAIARLSDCELVLIDTAGCSPHDAARLNELRTILTAACPNDVLVVASAVADAENLRTTADAFARLGACGLILTKLDEALLNDLDDYLAHCQLPLAYTTHGQNVADDLRSARILTPDS